MSAREGIAGLQITSAGKRRGRTGWCRPVRSATGAVASGNRNRSGQWWWQANGIHPFLPAAAASSGKETCGSNELFFFFSSFLSDHHTYGLTHPPGGPSKGLVMPCWVVTRHDAPRGPKILSCTSAHGTISCLVFLPAHGTAHSAACAHSLIKTTPSHGPNK